MKTFENCDGKEEENITIKSVYKGGIYEIISNANLNDKKEIKYKDKNGDKIISVFKWNKSKKEIIEFLLKEITIKNNNNAPKYKRKSKVKQKSYTKCRYIDNKGQMIETITNQIGKKCISIYIKDDDDQPTIKQLKNILHLPNENNENNDDQKDYKLPQFPINIIEIEKIVTERKDDDEKLNIENVKIQKEIQKLSEQITILKEKLIIKTEELKHNITKNDELISQKNTIKKWGEFQSEWNNWDCLYFMGWLQRIKWENKNYNSYNITKNGINRYCMKTFNTKHFIGKYLIKFDRDAMRQIGIEDEKDSFCIYKQILDLIKKYPLKQYQSPLKYYGEEKKINNNNNINHIKNDLNDVNELDDLQQLLNDIGLSEYYQIFKKNGFEDINTFIDCIKHKGIEYVEKNILSHKMKINKISHRVKLLKAFEKCYQNSEDDFEEHNTQDLL